MQANRLSYEYTMTDKILFTRRRAAASLGLTAAALCVPGHLAATLRDPRRRNPGRADPGCDPLSRLMSMPEAASTNSSDSDLPR